MGKLRVGDTAPDFSALDQNNEEIRLTDFVGSRGIVLFFYPKDGTPICTKEVCAFRDSYAKFQESGFEVIGVSSDSAERHQQFADQNRVPFSLIPDTNSELRRKYSVSSTLGIFPGRQTFVIDRNGKICLAYAAQFASDDHVTRAMAAVQKSE